MPTPPPELIFETIEELGLLVSCQTAASPSDAEWDAYLAAVQVLLSKHKNARILAVTAGGHPTRAQQDRAKKQPGRPLPVAIVSKAVILRFVASVFALLNPMVECYAPENKPRAYAHLKLSEAQRKVADACVERLNRKLTEAHSGVAA